MVLSANRTANTTVQRLRLRSTSEPPPNGPAPVPTPNAPDSPASFPECISTRKISTTEMSTWSTDRNGTIGGDLRWYPLAGLRSPIEGAQNLHRLGAKVAVDRLIVLI